MVQMEPREIRCSSFSVTLNGWFTINNYSNYYTLFDNKLINLIFFLDLLRDLLVHVASLVDRVQR